MLIKHDNNEVLNLFYEKFKDYGKQYEGLLQSYQTQLDKIHFKNDDDLKKIIGNDFEQAVLFSTRMNFIYSELSRNLDPILNTFTQEMLFRIVAESPYKILSAVCKVKLYRNISYIDFINTSYSSGRIFNLLKNITKEDKIRLLELREFSSTYPISEVAEMKELLHEVKVLIEKSLTSDLTDELAAFAQKHNIQNIQELQIHQAGVENQMVLQNSGKFRNTVNDLFGPGCGEYMTKDDAKQLQKISFIIPKDK